MPSHVWSAPPDALILSEDEVHIWLADLDESAYNAPEVRKVISRDELARANRFLHEHDRRRSIGTRAILRSLLAMYTGIPAEAISFHYHTNGKPFMPGESGWNEQPNRRLEFNLSHSGNLALFAFSWNRRIGVDIEKIRLTTDIERLARRVLDDEEYATFQLCTPAHKAQTLYRYWTCKEAVIKAAEQTIAEVRRIVIPLNMDIPSGWMQVKSDTSAGSWALRELEPPAAYTAALAAESPATLSFWKMPG